MSVTFPEAKATVLQRPPAGVPEFRVAKMTVPEYLSLVDEGFFGSRRVELWEGWVIDRMTHGSLPATLIMVLAEWLSERRPKDVAIRTQIPLQLADSCPEPDVAVVRGKTRDFEKRHPVAPEVLLIIEVADSTVDDDRAIKGRMYASAGIKEYWIVNCEDRQVEVYTEPQSVTEPPGYQRLTKFAAGQLIPVRIGADHLGDLSVSELFC